MKWLPTGLGAEPKKLVALVVLLAAVPALYYYNSQPDIPPGARVQRPATAPGTTPTVSVTPPRAAKRPTAARVNEDFHPSLKLPEDYDLSSIDPTLKLDLLARVRSANDAGGKRSLFEFYTPPPPPVKVDPIKPTPPKPVDVPKPVSTTPAKPPPTPIPFKFYGYAGAVRDGNLRALLVEGEETFVVRVGDVVRNRWRITRIGVTTVDVEDMTAKSTQPLQILPKCDDKDDTRCKAP